MKDESLRRLIFTMPMKIKIANLKEDVHCFGNTEEIYRKFNGNRLRKFPLNAMLFPKGVIR